MVTHGEGYPSKANRAWLRDRGIAATIPERDDQVAHRRKKPGRPIDFGDEQKPTQNNIILNIETVESNNFDYELFDFRGRMLMQNKANTTETLISLDSYADGVYILNVRNGRTLAKSFKIIKRTL